jgi:hypothetical protein
MTQITKGKRAGSKAGNQYGTFKVHYCSLPQARFIARLLEERDHPFDITDATKVNKRHASRIIEQLLACPKKAGVFTPPTEKQLSFIDHLRTSRKGGDIIVSSYLFVQKVESINQLQREQVTLLIEALKAQPIAEVINADPVIEVGAYMHDGTIYSVRKGRESNILRAYIFNADEHRWDYVPRMVEKISASERLTLAQAVQHSSATGSCVHCGRTLTLQSSVVRGMGAVCASRYK